MCIFLLIAEEFQRDLNNVNCTAISPMLSHNINTVNAFLGQLRDMTIKILKFHLMFHLHQEKYGNGGGEVDQTFIGRPSSTPESIK